MPYFNVQRWSLWGGWGWGGGGIWGEDGLVSEEETGMKAEAGRHFQTEMFDAGAPRVA